MPNFVKFKFYFLLVLLTFNFLLLTSPVPVHACHNPNNRSADTTPPPNSGPCPASLTEIEQVFTNLISVVVGLGFVALLVMLIWAGFRYLTSGGEPKIIQEAHNTVTWALLGIIFLALAWLILQLVGVITDIKVTFFDIRTLCDAVGNPGKWCGP